MQSENKDSTTNNLWIIKAIRLIDVPYKNRTFKEKLIVIQFYALVGLLGVFVIGLIRTHKKSQVEKNKLKYFKPTIYEGIFTNKISWELRDKPLTDQELSDLKF